MSPYTPRTEAAAKKHEERGEQDEDEVDEAAAVKQAGLDEVSRHRDNPRCVCGRRVGAGGIVRSHPLTFVLTQSGTRTR